MMVPLERAIVWRLQTHFYVHRAVHALLEVVKNSEIRSNHAELVELTARAREHYVDRKCYGLDRDFFDRVTDHIKEQLEKYRPAPVRCSVE